jgi:hypothetical protein
MVRTNVRHGSARVLHLPIRSTELSVHVARCEHCSQRLGVRPLFIVCVATSNVIVNDSKTLRRKLMRLMYRVDHERHGRDTKLYSRLSSLTTPGLLLAIRHLPRLRGKATL